MEHWIKIGWYNIVMSWLGIWMDLVSFHWFVKSFRRWSNFLGHGAAVALCHLWPTGWQQICRWLTDKTCDHCHGWDMVLMEKGVEKMVMQAMHGLCTYATRLHTSMQMQLTFSTLSVAEVFFRSTCTHQNGDTLLSFKVLCDQIEMTERILLAENTA